MGKFDYRLELDRDNSFVIVLMHEFDWRRIPSFTRMAQDKLLENALMVDERRVNADMKIKKVIFNDPATIVLWEDGTKTVVKANNERFDPEKGLSMCIAKKSLGNSGNYYDKFKKWIPESESEIIESETPLTLTKTCPSCNGRLILINIKVAKCINCHKLYTKYNGKLMSLTEVSKYE